MTALDERPSTAPPSTTAPSQPVKLPRNLRPQPRTTTHAAVTWSALGIVGLVVWIFGYTLWLTSLSAAHDQSVLYAQFRQQVADATAPLGGAIGEGAPVGVISMPSAGVHDQVIVEGTSAGDLMSGPGHRSDSPLPGQTGVSLVYGRSELFGGPFGDIGKASPGDTITVRTGEGLAKYVVEQVRREGDPHSPTLASGGGRLTLVTSEGDGWRSGWAPSRTVYVDASLASKPFGTPAGRPRAVPEYQTALHGDSAALYSLVLWLPVLLGAVILCIWAQNRWGRLQTWLVGVPVLLALLWASSQSAVQLLPNLM